jgi:hypothetical protein
MTPDEAAYHEWLTPSSSCIMSKSMRDQKENNVDHQSSHLLTKKYQLAQPLTPNTILPDIKTPSAKMNGGVNQRYSKERTKGIIAKLLLYTDL